MQSHQDNQAPNEEPFYYQNSPTNKSINKPTLIISKSSDVTVIKHVAGQSHPIVNQPIKSETTNKYEYFEGSANATIDNNDSNDIQDQSDNQTLQRREMSDTETIPTTHTLQATQSHFDNQAAPSNKSLSSVSSAFSYLPLNLSMKTTNTDELTSKNYSGNQIRETFDSSLTENRVEKEINDKQSSTCNLPNCNKNFKYPSDLRSLNKLKNTSKKSFSCDYCSKLFTSKFYLENHMRAHTGEKPFSCDICGKSFTQKYTLKSHNLTHTGEKAFSCDKCGKNFTHKSNLNKHNLIHTGEKAFLCDKCGKSFTQKGSLNKHNLTYTGEKPYVCKICHKCFTQSHNLKIHFKKHNEKDEKL